MNRFTDAAIDNVPSLKEVMDYSYDSIFVTNAEGLVIMVNPTAERLLNLPAARMVGVNVNELVAAGFWDKSMALEAIEKKATVTGVFRTKNGANLLCTSRPVFDANGDIIVVISSSRDRDALLKLAQTLRKERELTQRYKEEAEYRRDQELKNLRLIAESPAMQALVQEANTVGPTDTAVLLLGESGTGKEIMAKYLHSISRRSKQAFISVNCSAIPENLIEAELFGYEKGSFTGADARGKTGLFELAAKGTIFLDEIGEMPLNLQAKLLRVLELGEVRRIGSGTTRKVNFRLICATNRNLKKMVAEKIFREDLYYRINVVPLRISPLRERPEDIIAMSNVFLAEFNKKYGLEKVFSTETLDAFLNYEWPGNARELRNIIERLMITVKDRVIDYSFEAPRGRLQDGPVVENEHRFSVDLNGGTPLKQLIAAVEREYIQRALKRCNGCVSKAARLLGVDRTAIYRKTGNISRGESGA
ncbi:MAG: sigma 54-interacting transcriptional regulator [Gracilibacteraceae bacterium]|nr:sigma 54-interacting transcriptional regulator [Gracilibacteraceae bacterium]